MRHLKFVIVVAALGTAPAALARQNGGGTLTIGPGAVLEDTETGATHTLQLNASEFKPGIGAVTLAIDGGGVQLCTVQGGGSFVLGQPAPTPMCGTAGGMVVRIDKCRATIEAHGAAHTDLPHPPFMGPVTMDISYNNCTTGDGRLEITLHTPKRQIVLKGKVSGSVTMPTRNF
jgi:hypothetical protein